MDLLVGESSHPQPLREKVGHRLLSLNAILHCKCCVYTECILCGGTIEGVADGITTGNETMESEDGAGQSEDGPSQTVEGLFGDAADLSSSLVTPEPGHVTLT